MTFADKDKELKFATLLADIRNSLQTITEVLDAYISYLGTVEQGTYDLGKIVWQKAEGPSGSYEKAVKQEITDYVALLKDIEDHQGKLTRQGLFFWVFSDGSTVGRKPDKKGK